MLKKHRIFRSKPNHCISSGQNVQPFLKSIPERNAVARSSLVALLLPKLQKCKKSTVCPRTNIMKYRLRGGIPCSSLYTIQLKRHRLHSTARDDLARQIPQMLQQYFHPNEYQYNAPSHFCSFAKCFHHMISTEYSH